MKSLKTPKKNQPKQRQRSTKLMQRGGLPKGQWHPQLVGVISGYPSTLAIWQNKSDIMKRQVALYRAEGLLGRNGVPDGFAGQKDKLEAAKADGRERAKEIVQIMADKEIIDGDDPKAVLALNELVSIMITKASKTTEDGKTVEVYMNHAKDRIAAAGKVLEFTKQKPTVKSDTTIRGAEEWLLNLK